MAKAYFELDTTAFRKHVLQADFMAKAIEGYARKLTDSDHHIKSFIGVNRAHSIVYQNTKRHPE